MRLVCKVCRWVPPLDLTLGVVRAHIEAEHPNPADDVRLDLVPICECGTEMTFVDSRPTGGGEKHYYRCDGCGAEGWVKQSALDRFTEP
jgi:hypothetical protein